ncbi:MAG TPA: translation initiation factor [Vicinamibacterales bacterium]|nr:translation initiation factor [Vicinamibacterales bacterium]
MSEFNNPFGALKALKDRLPPAPEPVQPAAAPAETAKAKGPGGKTYPRAVVRMERAGRGGKEATVIEQLELAPAEREQWLKALKAALGCGGSISGADIMLQGDHRERLKTLLSARGVKRVIIG